MIAAARSARASLAPSLSCDPSIKRASATSPSPGRESTCSTIEWVIVRRELSRSGVPAVSRSKVSRFQWA